MDFDADRYCDLSKCLTSACPGDAPASAGWIQKSLCDAATDCNDKASSVHPGAPEYCGDNVDSNCKGGDSDPYAHLKDACPVGTVGVC